jgi:1-acyl-sn-glycerol-3-phosphate acyltransferase
MGWVRTAWNWSRVGSRVIFWGILALIADLGAPFWRPARNASQWFMYRWARGCAWGLRIKRQLIGGEILQAAPQCIIVANHLSLLDVVILGGYLNRDYRWVAKESVFKVPIMGQHMHLAGHIPVYRVEPQKNRALPLRIHEAVAQGASILFFPEGTRSPDGRLQPFKPGAFRTAVEEGLPVLPVLLRGTDRLLRKGQMDLAVDVDRQVTVEVLPLISPPPPGDDARAAAQALQDEVHALFARELGRLEREHP